MPPRAASSTSARVPGCGSSARSTPPPRRPNAPRGSGARLPRPSCSISSATPRPSGRTASGSPRGPSKAARSSTSATRTGACASAASPPERTAERTADWTATVPAVPGAERSPPMSTPTLSPPPPDDSCGDPMLDAPPETTTHRTLRTPRLDEQRELLALVETTGELSSSRYEPRALPSAITLARMIATSPLCPLALRGREADVLLVMMTGAEIGLTTMQSLRNLYIVEGRIGMSAALIRGRCQKHGDCALFEVAEADAAHAVVEVKKRGWTESRRVSWSIADAERAGLIKEDQPDS